MCETVKEGITKYHIKSACAYLFIFYRNYRVESDLNSSEENAGILPAQLGEDE